MRKTAIVLVAALAVGVMLVGCSGEPKPSKPGAYLVMNEKLAPLPVFVVDSDLSSEGFTSYNFTDEPTAKMKPGEGYFILFGEIRPLGIRAFQKKGGRFELDSSKNLPGDALEISLMKGETKMYKCRISKSLPVGVYVIDMQKGQGTVSMAFRLAY
jgi:hypothetical protein